MIKGVWQMIAEHTSIYLRHDRVVTSSFIDVVGEGGHSFGIDVIGHDQPSHGHEFLCYLGCFATWCRTHIEDETAWLSGYDLCRDTRRHLLHIKKSKLMQSRIAQCNARILSVDPIGISILSKRGLLERPAS